MRSRGGRNGTLLALALAFAAQAGCFDPSVREGLPCGPPPESACPEGQECQLDGTCRRPGGEADAPAGDAPDELDAPLGTPDARLPDAGAPWTVAIIPELAMPGALDQDASMTADGLEIVWSSDRPGGLGLSDIWHATRTSTSLPFSNLEPMPNVNSASREQSPEIGRLGGSLFLVSSRDGTHDVFATFRAGPAVAFPAPGKVTGLSTDAFQEPNVSVHSNTTAVVDRENAAGTDRDLYLSVRTSTSAPWPSGTPIAEVNTTTYFEGAPFLTADDLALYFHRLVPPNGAYQMYVATRTDASQPFGPPQPIMAVDDSDPWVSDDGQTMLFTRSGDVYIATR